LVSEKSISDFNSLAGKNIGMAYFTNRWFSGIKFPMTMANAAKANRAVPRVRMSPWQVWDKAGPYTIQAIASGTFDADLKKWGEDAKRRLAPNWWSSSRLNRMATGFHGQKVFSSRLQERPIHESSRQ
jgi:hypothetical protein